MILAPAVTFPVLKNWKKAPMPGQAPTRMMGVAYTLLNRFTAAKLTVQPAPLDDSWVRGNGLEDGLDMDMLLYVLQNDPWVFLIQDDSTEQLIQRTGMFAVCANTPALEAIAGPNFQGEAFEFDEVPN